MQWSEIPGADPVSTCNYEGQEGVHKSMNIIMKGEGVNKSMNIITKGEECAQEYSTM